MITDPILGELKDVYQNLNAPQRLWQGTFQTDLFSEPLLVQFEGTDTVGLTVPLQHALTSFLEQSKNYKHLSLEALLTYYRGDILPLWRANNYFGAPELAPDIHTPLELETLLSCPRLLLHNATSWGLEFECSWDVEHGAGVLFRDDRIVATGLAEIAHSSL